MFLRVNEDTNQKNSVRMLFDSGKPVNALASFLGQTCQSLLGVLHQGKSDRALWVL